jgi:hypothetical protein
LPEIFQFAERIHRARIESVERFAVDRGRDYPGIGGAVIVRDSDGEADLPGLEHPAE